MLTKAGHTVYHYGCEGSNPVCTEQVDVITNEYRLKFYPDDFTESYKYDINDELHNLYRKNTIDEIHKRAQPKDFLLCQWGWAHKPIADALTVPMMVVESGIGYEDTFAKFRVFESHTWMNWVYGKDKASNGSWYDCAIPNYFDSRDFTYNDKKEDWFLYIGRLIHLKGVDIASQICKAIGAKLVVAGQGKQVNPNENLDLRGDHIEFVGFADVEKRRDLMSRARGVFVPTYYVEPFGGVSIEAAMSGTPVLTTDWGVFAENVLHGITGYRCRTFEQFCWAAKNIHTISPAACRQWAMDNFSMERVTQMYEEYFDMIYQLWSDGWYAQKPERNNLDWLKRYYPQNTLPVQALPLTVNPTPVVPRIHGPIGPIPLR